jgi:hypothetical protein
LHGTSGTAGHNQQCQCDAINCSRDILRFDGTLLR